MDRVVKIYEDWRAKKPADFAKLDTAFDRWLNFYDLTKSQFNEEGRHHVGDKGIRLAAFKGGGLRFYGVTTNINGTETFLVSLVDKNKQSKKARMPSLQLAAERASKFL